MSFLSSAKAWVHHPGRRVMRRSTQARATYNRIARVVKWRQLATSRRLLAEGVPRPRRFEIKAEDGYALCVPDLIPHTSDVVALTKKLVGSGILREREGGPKAQLLQYSLPIETLTTDSAFLRFALDPTLLAGIARYFGVAPILTYIGIWESRNVAGAVSNSQLFHCDFEDQTQMKVFVFCSEVTLGHGPLTVIPAIDGDTVTKHVGYSFNSASSYRVRDEEVEAVVPAARWKALVGPEGTVAFVDTTRCFHFGSRVTQADTTRLMAVFQYVTPFAFGFPLFFSATSPFSTLAATNDWSGLQRFSLTGR